MWTYENIIGSMSSKDMAGECAKEDCQKEMKRMMLEKMDDAYTSNEGKTCVVCYEERNGTFVLQPCGHAKTCEECCMKIVVLSLIQKFVQFVEGMLHSIRKYSISLLDQFYLS